MPYRFVIYSTCVLHYATQSYKAHEMTSSINMAFFAIFKAIKICHLHRINLANLINQ
jgi:hypothetical protein